jgi:hypothetical protein
MGSSLTRKELWYWSERVQSSSGDTGLIMVSDCKVSECYTTLYRPLCGPSSAVLICGFIIGLATTMVLVEWRKKY